MEKRDYASILFTPEQIGNLGAAYLKQRRENKDLGIKLGLDVLDAPDKKGNLLLPLVPGELVSIIGRPGNGKTGFMVRWARSRAKILNDKGIKTRVIPYITLEQSIEELNAFNVAADSGVSITKMATGEITEDDWQKCLKHAVGRRFLPMWFVGYSSMTTGKQIRVDLDAIRGALELLRSEHALEIDMVFIDYLQRIPYDKAESKTIGISDNLDSLKTMALQLKCPVVVGVQARREVDDTDPAVPQLDDGQWTSNIEQTSDKVLTIVRPSRYKGELEKFGNQTVTGNKQMVIGVAKQKLGPANFSKWVEFDPIYNTLNRLEERYYRD